MGNRLPDQRAYAFASSQDTCVTGSVSFPLMLLPGPRGCFQLAPFVHAHQDAGLFISTGVDDITNTSDEATSNSGAGFGVPGGNCFLISFQSGAFSAVVT